MSKSTAGLGMRAGFPALAVRNGLALGDATVNGVARSF